MIKAYVLSHCPKCEKLKKYLKQHQIPYQEYNVEKDTSALAKMTLEGLNQYPVLEINGRFYTDDWKLGILRER